MLNDKLRRWPIPIRMTRGSAWSLGIILATIVCLASYMALPMHQTSAAITAIEASGGIVFRPESGLTAEMRRRGFAVPKVRTGAPFGVSFMECKIGTEAIRAMRTFRGMKRLFMRGVDVGDRTLIDLFSENQNGTTPFPALTILYLDESSVSDIGIQPIPACRNLTSLNVSGTRISNETVALIACLTKLRVLDLSDTGVTNGCLTHLRPFADLWYLNLAGAKISEIEPVADLPFVSTIERLDLSRTSIGNDAGPVLSRFANLNYLRLAACNIDDDLLKAIRVLPNLEHLEIQGTNVSGDGLAYLTPMKQLRYLDLTDTKVTPSGIQHLKTQRPNLSIVHESLPP